MERISVGHTNFVVRLEVKVGLPLIRHEDFQPSRKEKNTHVYDTGMNLSPLSKCLTRQAML